MVLLRHHGVLKVYSRIKKQTHEKTITEKVGALMLRIGILMFQNMKYAPFLKLYELVLQSMLN